jgi:dihydrofolate reductase
MDNPIRLYMSMSLDGFIAGLDDRAGQELGRNGGRLFDWLDDRESDGPSGQVYRELMATGAVISGRRTFELAGRSQGDHHDGVPIFVLTHRAEVGDVPPGHARFATDVEDCAGEARAAAEESAVMVHGAGAAQALLRAGLMDEVEIHLGRGTEGMKPGSMDGVFLVVPDVRAARADLVGPGRGVGEVQVFDDGAYRPAREEEPLDLVGFVFFDDPDGNRWRVQQIPARD